ncbi:uncharacterized protein [Parasteatoda tepidariorum]|uniref:uncharacterized protein n=1 Tax=Parasteatoda tepidariorum TaxID=114398 RepID=UPI0039BD2062
MMFILPAFKQNSKGKKDDRRFKLRDWAEVLAEQKAAEQERTALDEVQNLDKSGDENFGEVEGSKLAEKLTSAEYGIKNVDKDMEDEKVEEQKAAENLKSAKFPLKNWDIIIMEQIALDFHQNGFIEFDLKNVAFTTPHFLRLIEEFQKWKNEKWV